MVSESDGYGVQETLREDGVTRVLNEWYIGVTRLSLECCYGVAKVLQESS
jgi:hypothetical protein